MNNQYLETGKIVSTHGIRGEVKVQPWADSPEFLLGFKTLYLDETPVKVRAGRVHKGMVILALEGVEDVNAAMQLKGKDVFIAREDAGLPRGAYFIQDILGASVRDEQGNEIGKLTDVLERPASNIYVVQGEQEHLIPAVPAFILNTDAEAGVITNAQKTLHRGQSVATFLMGTRRLYDYVNNNPAVAMYPVDYVNDPYVIARNDNLVSINSCVQVDLMGQVASTSVGLRQISGVGGQVDFVRGANMSKGGRAIMAMPATTGKGKISKIVPFLDKGAEVTTSRNDVNYVITEYGIAQLRGKNLRQRAEALIEIAHPDFRDELRDELRRRYPKDY